MARFTLASAAVYLVGRAASSFLPGNILGALRDLGFVALLVPLAYYGFLGIRWLMRRVLWKVRNKIIVSYAFVGIIPLVIMALISFAFFWVVFSRLSGFYLEYELETLSETLERASRQVVTAHLRDQDQSFKALEERVEAARQLLPLGLRHAVFNVYQRSDSSELRKVFQRFRTSDESKTDICPAWLQSHFLGFTSRAGGVSFTSAVDLDEDLRLIVQLPFDDKTRDYLKRRTSIEILLTADNPQNRPEALYEAYAQLGLEDDQFRIKWIHFFQPVQWATGEPTESWSIILSIPVRTLLNRLLVQETGFWAVLIVVLLVALALVLFISALIGIGIARSITRSIYNLYSAVENINQGNFSFRIPSRQRDQLDDMADSFNEMSSSVVRLMNQISEREWIEKGLQIAREVQNQLFPQQLPEIDSVEIAASCSPARQVSGDYYDFIPHNKEHLDIVVGDISGKGISAALLMASLQSAIRSGLGEFEGNSEPRERMSNVVRLVNRQLYRRSSPESYSTLVLNHFDAGIQKLFYCNAGHHPPLHFSASKVSGLTVGGTVVGLFENWEFDAGEVQLAFGDLVLFFTDGVVEAENNKGEQFGTDRLIELVRGNTFLTAEDIQALVVEQVFDWSSGLEQADDITVVCLKIVGESRSR